MCLIKVFFILFMCVDSETCLEANDFRCQSTGACIRQVKVCDGIVHCSDGSDETNCSTYLDFPANFQHKC